MGGQTPAFNGNSYKPGRMTNKTEVSANTVEESSEYLDRAPHGVKRANIGLVAFSYLVQAWRE